MLNHGAQPMVACDYHIARILATIMEQTQGKLLAEEDRMLWKMGYNVSDRRSIRPAFFSTRSDDGTVISWSVSGGRLWFPANHGTYAKLWEAVSGGGSYAELIALAEADPLALEEAMRNISRVWKTLLSGQPEPKKLPPAFLRRFMMSKWLANLAREHDVAPMVRCCLAGVPAADILA